MTEYVVIWEGKHPEIDAWLSFLDFCGPDKAQAASITEELLAAPPDMIRNVCVMARADEQDALWEHCSVGDSSGQGN